MKKKSSNQLEF